MKKITYTPEMIVLNNEITKYENARCQPGYEYSELEVLQMHFLKDQLRNLFWKAAEEV